MADGGRRNADEILALGLAAGKEMREAAAAASMSERTAYRRLSDPGFRQRVNVLRGELVDRALGKLSDASAAAVETLQGLLAATSESTRLGAARAILELGVKVRTAVELETRVQELEAATASKGISPSTPRFPDRRTA